MTNPKPCWDATKAYFYQDATIHTWWAPEAPDSIHYHHFREQLSWVVSQVEWSGKRVLDIGTGKGRLAVAAALRGARVTGLDLSAEMLRDGRQAARDASLSLGFALGDAELLPFPNQMFDVVTCLEALMHFPRPEVALPEMARVVRSGGTVIFSVTNWLCLTALTRRIARLSSRLRHPGRTKELQIFWYRSLWSLRRLAACAGLTILKTHGQGLLQATARLPFGRGRFLPLVPGRLADWFFCRVEPALRDTPLLALMGTILVVCQATTTDSGRAQ